MHFPFPFFSQELLADAMTQLHQEGTIKAVGVCNYNPDQMRTLHGLLAKQGIPLASNQVTPPRSRTPLVPHHQPAWACAQQAGRPQAVMLG